MGEIKFIVGLTFAALFTIAIIAYVLNFGADNQVAINLADDPDLSPTKTNTESDLTTFTTSINSSSGGFFKSDVESGDELLRGGAQFKTGPKEIIGTTKTAASLGFSKIFGSDNQFGIILTTFISLLIFIAILYVWKSWRGNPD